MVLVERVPDLESGYVGLAKVCLLGQETFIF